jgi:5-methylcytosine-specific restriction enzyme subunit McrC
MTPDPTRLILQEHQKLTTRDLSEAQARRLAGLPQDQLAIGLGGAPGEYVLTAGPVIGDILSAGLHITILPKVPIHNLFYMLGYATEGERWDQPPLPIGHTPALLPFIVRIFVSRVDRLVRQGIQRGYIDIDESHRYLRGRLLMGDHLRQTVARPGLFHQRTNEFTADLPENRILKAALDRLERTPALGAELRQRLRHAGAAFGEVPSVPITPADCDRVVYTRLNERYRSPIQWARLLLQNLSLEARRGPTPFATYLLPMHSVFERFVAAYLAGALAGRPGMAIAVQKTIPLDHDGALTGTPDIVIRRAGRRPMLLDTKYKAPGETPSNADVFQMHTYAKVLDAERAVLIYPAEAEPRVFTLRDGVIIAMQPLSLAGGVAAFEARCAALARGLVGEVDWETLPPHRQDAIDRLLIDEVRSAGEETFDLADLLAGPDA